MIKLSIKPYCQDCPMFDPEVITAYPLNGWEPLHTVQCVRKEECKHILRYLENRIAKETKEKENGY